MVKRAVTLAVSCLFFTSAARAERLPTTVTPTHYDLKFAVDLANARFDGTETIHVQVASPTAKVVLNAAEIAFGDVTIGAGASAQKATVALNAEEQTATFSVPTPLPAGASGIHIAYRGILNNELGGVHFSKTKNRNQART